LCVVLYKFYVFSPHSCRQFNINTHAFTLGRGTISLNLSISRIVENKLPFVFFFNLISIYRWTVSVFSLLISKNKTKYDKTKNRQQNKPFRNENKLILLNLCVW